MANLLTDHFLPLLQESDFDSERPCLFLLDIEIKCFYPLIPLSISERSPSRMKVVSSLVCERRWEYFIGVLEDDRYRNFTSLISLKWTFQ